MEILVHGSRVVGGARRLLENKGITVHGDAEQFMVGSVIVVAGCVMLVMAVW